MGTGCFIALAGLLCGCVHVKPECTTHGGTPWLELTSQHFVVRTNLEPAAARAAAVQLEQARAAELSAFPTTGTTPPLEVVLFTDPAQLHELSGDVSLDAALLHDWRGPMLLTASSATFMGATQLPLTLHELAHHYSAAALERAPKWFDEGLAIYLETIIIDADAKTAVRGVANQARLNEATRWGILPVDSLWSWDGELESPHGVELHRAASSWFWVHWLFNEQRPALDRFMRALSEGTEPHAAWASAFGALTAESMKKAADAYLEAGRSRSQKMDLSELNVALEERALSDAQVHALLARTAGMTGAWPRAREEARTAISLDAHEVSAQEQNVATQESAEARMSVGRQLTQENAQDPVGWLLLGLSLPSRDPERGQALSLAAELDPRSAMALSELASFRCAEARCAEGVPLAERAAELAPGNARVLAGTASVQLQAGLCAQAVVTQQRALEVLPERAPVGLRKQLQARLTEYSRCTAR